MALPAVADVRRQHPDAVLHVAARSSVAPLFEMVPGVDAVVTLPGRGGLSSLLSWRDQAATLAAGAYDAALLLPNSFASAMAVSHAGIPERWGFGTDARARLLTRVVSKPAGDEHHAAYYQALTTGLGMPAGALHPHIEVPAAARHAARALLDEAGVGSTQRAIVFAPGAAYGRAKQWVPERFAELASMLAAEGMAVVLVGSGADRDVCAEISERVQRINAPHAASASSAARSAQSVADLCGRTSLHTLAGVLALASGCVSNDSGAMHLAAAVGARLVAVFGATDERHTAPLPSGPDAMQPRVVTADVWCRPCLLRECPIDHRCMTRISAAQVREALLTLQVGAGL